MRTIAVQMEIPDGNGTTGVQNDGMSDLPSQGQRGAGRPSSAQLNKERHERIHLLKEKQDHDRLKKLEELKEQAFAATRLREEQDSRRKKHFEELVKKEDDRRKQAEERRRMLDEERKLALQAKWDSRTAKPSPRAQSAKPSFAFGSCTPRLVDNHVDGCLWKSQYNLNVTREPGMRASSATDLHIQQNQCRMSTSYSWNQQQTTLDKPLVQLKNGNSYAYDRRLTKSRSNYDGADAMRIFCGRRRTDLTPTIPIKREAYDMSASMMSTRSTASSRGSGRVYTSISMTRLDRSRSPGYGTLSVPQHQHQGHGQRPSRSKSTTHLSSTGLKMTRTEILRQALAAKKDVSGFRSVDQTRPPSSMSSSMTSSTHSQVQMRPRNMTHKSRPASVHVTGVSQENNTNGTSQHPRRRVDTSQERKSNASSSGGGGTPVAPTRKPEPKKLLTGKVSPSHAASTPSSATQSGETGTIKRPVKKTPSAPKEKSTAATGAGATTVVKDGKGVQQNSPSVKQSTKEEQNSLANEGVSPVPVPVPEVESQAPVVPEAFANTNPFSNNPFESESSEVLVENSTVSLEKEFNNLNNENEMVTPTPPEVNVEINNTKNESNVRVGGGNNQKVIDNFESIGPELTSDFESAFASGSDYSIKTPEPFAAPTSVVANEGHVEKVNNFSALDDLLGSELDFTNATTPNNLMVPETKATNGTQEEVVKSQSVSPAPTDADTDSSKPKIMTEEQAKAAIQEKRRLAREAAEREAAREVEEQRLEEERQRLEAEEADRVARDARAAEEERLRIAIEEQQKKEAEEKLRQEEEEKVRIEKEKQDREAAREAERVRIEMEERLKREEEERLERRKRVEAIMARTRKKEQEQQQAKTNSAEQGVVEPVNGHKEHNVLIGDTNNVQSSNNSLNNNYNNNNDFGNNSTLIEFDGMMGGGGGGQESNNLMGDSNTGLISNSSTSNPLISNPLQDLLS